MLHNVRGGFCMFMLLAVLGCAALGAQAQEYASIQSQIKIKIQKASGKAHERGKKMLKDAQKSSSASKSDTGKGKNRPRPRPIFEDESLPCNEGGGDCSDYEDECNTYRCNRAQKFCKASPKVGGTCTDFFSDACNTGPGKCVPAFGGGSPFGVCFGTPNPGGSCDDYNECTDDDVCKVGRDGAAEVGICEGSFSVGKSCNDDDDCSVNDKCTVEKGSGRSPDFIFCQGTPKAGLPCNDYNDCTVDDQCQAGNDYTFCEGTPKPDGAACDNDYQCADGGQCVTEGSGDYEYTFCQENPAVGNDCEDANSCTDGDKCVLGDSGDYSFCRGEPLPEGTSCEGYDNQPGTCTVDGDYAYCSY